MVNVLVLNVYARVRCEHAPERFKKVNVSRAILEKDFWSFSTHDTVGRNHRRQKINKRNMYSSLAAATAAAAAAATVATPLRNAIELRKSAQFMVPTATKIFTSGGVTRWRWSAHKRIHIRHRSSIEIGKKHELSYVNTERRRNSEPPEIADRFNAFVMGHLWNWNVCKMRPKRVRSNMRIYWRAE